MKKPAWRTVLSVLALALMGGIVCVAVHGAFADYATLLKALGWAVAVKSGFQHGTHVFQKPPAAGEAKP